MNHRKLHLLKPTVYSYPHSNSRLVKTGWFIAGFPQHSILPKVPPACGASPSEEKDGDITNSVFLSSISHTGISVVRKLEILQSHFPEMFLTSDRISYVLPTQMPAAGLTSWRGQREWGTWGGCKCQTGLNEWGEERRGVPLSLFFSSLAPFLLPSLAWPLSPAITSVGPLWNGLSSYQGQEMGLEIKPWLAEWVWYTKR